MQVNHKDHEIFDDILINYLGDIWKHYSGRNLQRRMCKSSRHIKIVDHFPIMAKHLKTSMSAFSTLDTVG